MPEPSGPVRMRQVRYARAVLSVSLLAAIAFAPRAQASMLGSMPRSPELPVTQVLGCRLHGLAIVCGPDGSLIPRRKSKEHQYKEGIEPSNKGPSTKAHSSRCGTPKKKEGPSGSNGSDKDTAEQPATEEDAGVHACPPGNVVLEKADTSGSYCEPVAVMTPQVTPTPEVTEEKPTQQSGANESQAPAAAETNTETLTPPPAGLSAPPSPPPPSTDVNNSGTPQTETPAAIPNPQSAAPTSTNTTAAKRICCKSDAFSKSTGPAYSLDGLSVCGATELDAKKLIDSFADAGNYRLSGPITCESK